MPSTVVRRCRTGASCHGCCSSPQRWASNTSRATLQAEFTAAQAFAGPQAAEDVVDGDLEQLAAERVAVYVDVALGQDAGKQLAEDLDTLLTHICHVNQSRTCYFGATNPTGPDAMHTDNAAVLARTPIASPAPGSRTNTRLRPGRTGTLTSGPSDSDIVSDPSLLAR